jgi:hypothetical protein
MFQLEILCYIAFLRVRLRFRSPMRVFLGAREKRFRGWWDEVVKIGRLVSQPNPLSSNPRPQTRRSPVGPSRCGVRP